MDWALKSKPNVVYRLNNTIKRNQREGEKSSNKTDGAEFAKKCVNSTTDSNNQDCLQLKCSSCSRKFRLTFLALRRKESSSVRQNIQLPKTKILPEVKMISRDLQRSPTVIHSKTKTSVNCVKRKGRKEELSSPRMTTLKAVSKKYDISISGKRKNVVSLIELCSCKALDNVAYKSTPVHYLTQRLDTLTKQRKFNNKKRASGKPESKGNCGLSEML